MSSASYTHEEIEAIGNEAREYGYIAGRADGYRAGLERARAIAEERVNAETPDYHRAAHATAVRIRDRICAELARTEVTR